jgi:hypothetical protein
VEAMLLRDEKGDAITEESWNIIDQMCIEAWTLMKKEL